MALIRIEWASGPVREKTRGGLLPIDFTPVRVDKVNITSATVWASSAPAPAGAVAALVVLLDGSHAELVVAGAAPADASTKGQIVGGAMPARLLLVGEGDKIHFLVVTA